MRQRNGSKRSCCCRCRRDRLSFSSGFYERLYRAVKTVCNIVVAVAFAAFKRVRSPDAYWWDVFYIRWWTVLNINTHWWSAAKRGQVDRRVSPELYLHGDPPLFLDFFEMMNIHRDNISRDVNPGFPLAILFWVIAIGAGVAAIFDLTAAWKPCHWECCGPRNTVRTASSGCVFPFSLLAGVVAPLFTMTCLLWVDNAMASNEQVLAERNLGFHLATFASAASLACGLWAFFNFLRKGCLFAENARPLVSSSITQHKSKTK